MPPGTPAIAVTMATGMRNAHLQAWVLLNAVAWVSGGDSGDTWRRMSTHDAPSARQYATAVWTGAEMIVWGGFEDPGRASTSPRFLASGGRYDPRTDRWTAVAAKGAPAPRAWHSAVWTGKEMIVWGGTAERCLDSGAAYDPARDSWRALSSTNAPRSRCEHSAVWTGTEMIVFGGVGDEAGFTDGARYDPATDAWRSIPPAPDLAPPRAHAAVWTGSAMVVWGGINGSRLLGGGGSYDPATDGWTALPSIGAPAARASAGSAWTGSAWIVFGGRTGSSGEDPPDVGGKYDPAVRRWTALPRKGAPAARVGPAVAWTGAELVVWGGSRAGAGGEESAIADGAALDPASGTWRALAGPEGFAGRRGCAAVWSGSELLLWGGVGASGPLSDGARLAPRRRRG
jgi:hypothetical protein